MTKTKLLDIEMIEAMTSMEEINQIVDKTFQEFGRRRVKNPTKVTLDLGQNQAWPDYDGFMNAMPAYIEWLDVAGLKWVGGFNGKRKEAGLPYINGMILMIDPQMGTFETILDGTFITNMRTGAQSAVAMKNLGFDRDQEITLGIFGTGEQANTQLMAIKEWYNIKEVKLWNHKSDSAEEFIDRWQDTVDFPINYYEDGADASDADVIVTVTKSKDPVINYDWLKPNTVVIPLGSDTEIDNQTIVNADYLVVDHVGQAMHRGALQDAFDKDLIDQNDVDATIGGLASGRVAIGDMTDAITLCVPVGMGALDIAVAGTLAKRAKEQNIGNEFDFKQF